MFFTVLFLILLLGLYFMTIVLSYRIGVFGMVCMHIIIGLYFLFGLGVAISISGDYEPEMIIGSQIFAFIANLLFFPFAVFAIWKGRKFRAELSSHTNTSS